MLAGKGNQLLWHGWKSFELISVYGKNPTTVTLIYARCIAMWQLHNNEMNVKGNKWTTIYISSLIAGLTDNMESVFCRCSLFFNAFPPPFMPFHFQFLSLEALLNSFDARRYSRKYRRKKSTTAEWKKLLKHFSTPPWRYFLFFGGGSLLLVQARSTHEIVKQMPFSQRDSVASRKTINWQRRWKLFCLLLLLIRFHLSSAAPPDRSFFCLHRRSRSVSLHDRCRWLRSDQRRNSHGDYVVIANRTFSFNRFTVGAQPDDKIDSSMVSRALANNRRKPNGEDQLKFAFHQLLLFAS